MFYYRTPGGVQMGTQPVSEGSCEEITEEEYFAAVAEIEARIAARAEEEAPEEPDERDLRIEELEGRVAELESENAELARTNLTLQRNNAALLRRAVAGGKEGHCRCQDDTEKFFHVGHPCF